MNGDDRHHGKSLSRTVASFELGHLARPTDIGEASEDMGAVLERGRLWDRVQCWVCVNQRGAVFIVVAVEGVAFYGFWEGVV